MIALLEAEAAGATAADRPRRSSPPTRDAIFDDGFSFVGGNPEGSVTIVEFLDYQCGFCRRAHPEVRELIAADGDIRWIVKEMPILGPGSELAARAAVATLIAEGPEAYAALHDRLMRLEGPGDRREPRPGAGRGRPRPRGDPRRRWRTRRSTRRLDATRRAGREAGDRRHADLRLRQPDGARLPAAGRRCATSSARLRATN